MALNLRGGAWFVDFKVHSSFAAEAILPCVVEYLIAWCAEKRATNVVLLCVRSH